MADLLLPRLAARIFNTPLMIHPAKLDSIIAGLSPRLIGHDVRVDAPRVDIGALMVAEGEHRDPGYRIIDGLAVIDVFGVLAHRTTMNADSSFVLGYETIAKRVDAALGDASVSAILLNIDSPGGEIAGVFDLAQRIHEGRQIKPIHAVVSDMAASAGYLIASAAETVSITNTGFAGSIGVVLRHVDISKAMENDGINVTFIFAGAKKVDGNAFEPLSDEVRADFQREIDALYNLFVERVALYRGIDQASVRATEAGVFRGREAIDIGLADFISSPDDAIESMIVEANRTDIIPTPGGKKMTTKAITKTNAAATEKQEEKIDHEAEIESARADGYKAGQSDERERISGILNHPEAKGRESQAKALALDTDLSIEQAGKVLAVSPSVVEPAAEPMNPFTDHMNALGNPTVGADTGDSNEMEESQAIQAGWANAFGHRLN